MVVEEPQPKVLRQQLVKRFGEELKSRIPEAKKGNGRFWTVSLNNHVYFYVTLSFPKYIQGDSTVEIFYGLGLTEVDPEENMIAHNEAYVTFPYNLHHKMFEFPDVPWRALAPWRAYKHYNKVGYLFWLLRVQKTSLHYYTNEQTNYVEEVLLPYAANAVNEAYHRYLKEYGGTDKSLPKIRVD